VWTGSDLTCCGPWYYIKSDQAMPGIPAKAFNPVCFCSTIREHSASRGISKMNRSSFIISSGGLSSIKGLYTSCNSKTSLNLHECLNAADNKASNVDFLHCKRNVMAYSQSRRRHRRRRRLITEGMFCSVRLDKDQQLVWIQVRDRFLQRRTPPGHAGSSAPGCAASPGFLSGRVGPPKSSSQVDHQW
jgi:hypothetical protein